MAAAEHPVTSPAQEPRPFLSFPPPILGPIPTMTTRRVIPKPQGPGAARQGQRLTPQFQALTDALSAERVQAAPATTAPDPELVVVFDLAGTVADFRRATISVPGLEFLAELDDDPSPADDDFHFVDRDGRAQIRLVPETLYLILTNAQAAAELVRLFAIWQTDPDAPFRRGLAPLKQAFAQLRSVRRWGPQDRVRDSGLLDAWAEDLQVAGMSSTRVEIELWFRDDAHRRSAAEAEVRRLVEEARGQVLAAAAHPGIDYHAVLAELPRSAVETVLEQGLDSIELLTAGGVMFVSPARPMSVPTLDLVAAPASSAPPAPTPAGRPRVALLDGLPLANHSELVGRVVIDDPDDRAQLYAGSALQTHGTAMASLICHGDLGGRARPLSTPLYSRPIMEPDGFFSDRETVTPNELLVDLVHRCFRRMFEGDADHPPAAPSIRVVNLSIGDPARIFSRRLSPLARLLDWLAFEYNVVVLVSAGNHPAPTVDASFSSDPARHTASHYQQARQRRLYSPAEAVNVITVGALHTDEAGDVTVPDTTVDMVPQGLPAVYGALGGGYARSVKPEVLLPGGRQRYVRPVPGLSGAVQLRDARQSSTGPGLRVAAPDQGGGLDATAFICGTSGATALATNAVSSVLDVLDQLTTSDGTSPDPQFHPVLAKTLLVHAAHWNDMPNEMTRTGALPAETSRTTLTQFLGYGPVDLARVSSAARNRVVLIGAAAIYDKQRHRFTFPLPGPLAASTDWRRLTITLGWLTPINPRSRTYRMARLSFAPPAAPLAVSRTEADSDAVRRGTIQHEVLEGRKAVAFVSGDSLQIDVDCRIDAGQVAAGIRYGLAATIEVAADVAVDLHTSVQQALQARVRPTVRQQA